MPGVIDLPVICMSAKGAMVTVSVAVLLERSGSPSTVFSTVLLLVKSPSRMPRNTVMGTVTVPPWASTPPF